MNEMWELRDHRHVTEGPQPHIYANMRHMRTTLTIDDDLHADLKRLAVSTGRTLTDVLEDAIRSLLDDVGTAAAQAPPVFPAFDGGRRPGIRPGVDLDDNAALLDLMDGPSDDPS